MGPWKGHSTANVDPEGGGIMMVSGFEVLQKCVRRRKICACVQKQK